MNFPDDIPVFGDVNFRGPCPLEHVELATIFNWLRREYPDSLGLIATHVRNEGLLEKQQFSTVLKHKAEGLTKGACDLVIPGRMTMCLEMKRQDHTRSKWQDKQIEYLQAAQNAGAFSCVALGAAAAREAILQWASSTK